MKKQVLFFHLLFCLFSCNNHYAEKVTALDFIPSEYNVVYRINSLADFNTSHDSYFPLKSKKIDSLCKSLAFLNSEMPLYIGIDKDNFILSTTYKNDIITSDSLYDIKSEWLESKDLFRTVFNKDTLYHKVTDSIFIASNRIDSISKIIQKSNLKLKSFFKVVNNKSLNSVFNAGNETDLLLNKKIASHSESILDIKTTENYTTTSGIIREKDSAFFLNAFKNTKPQEFKLGEIIPSDVECFTRISFDDYQLFSKQLNNISRDSISNLLQYTNEISLIGLKEEKAIAVSALDKDLLSEVIDIDNVTETYKDISIFTCNQTNIFKSNLSPILELDVVNFGCNIENFFIFSDDINTLKHIITSKLNNQTIFESEKFQSISEHLANASHLLIYKNEDGLKNYLDKDVKGYNTNAVQYVFENDFAHVNGIFSKYKKQPQSNSITEAFTVKLPASIIMQPQPVKNHVTGHYDVITQDTNNTLYLISNSGKIIWKKTLQSPIIGKVEQIDTYKNGRLQLAFATENRVYVIDRNGKDVDAFPLKFNDKITQPLSVFDYDKNRNYRLLVTQGKSLLMYDAKGKSVSGFKYKGASKVISSQPKHFRMASKDYIVFGQGNKLEILNRKGKERIKVKNNIDFSDNEIFNYRSRFTILNSKNQLVMVDTKGEANLKSIELQTPTKIDATSKTLAALSENKLKINSRIVDLDYGDYTPAKIFYVNDKLYITTTDLQSKKLYVYDSQAKLLPKFPIYASTKSHIENIDQKGKPEVITQSDDNTILVYKIN